MCAAAVRQRNVLCQDVHPNRVRIHPSLIIFFFETVQSSAGADPGFSWGGGGGGAKDYARTHMHHERELIININPNHIYQ